jgi:hypothetical protein
LPLLGTTSTIGSNWPEPLQAQSGVGLPHVTPPSGLTSTAIHGLGQLPGHGLGAA